MYIYILSISQYQDLNLDENNHVYGHEQAPALLETSNLEFPPLKKILADLSLFGISYVPGYTKYTITMTLKN